MKVTLFTLNRSYFHTSLALRCLRRPLENEGISVTVTELTVNDSYNTVIETLYSQKSDIYGFSCYIWNIGEMLAIAEDLKKLIPEARIFFGGPEISYDTERFYGEKFGFIDKIIRGAGEDVILPLCQNPTDSRFPRIIDGSADYAMSDEGILYRDGEMDKRQNAMLYYESSRGCPFSCSYCLSCATVGVKAKSIEQTLNDLLSFEKLNCDFSIIKFVDRTFNFDVRRANTIWRALLDDEKFTKKYHFEICAELLDEESFEILSRMQPGKIQVEAGLQSTCPETLAAVSRHLNAEKTLSAAKRIKDMGNIHVHLDLIAGLPYESYNRFAQSFNDAYYCCDMLQVGFLKLLHGTRARDESDKYGYVYRIEPPYTVLSNDFISFDELLRLEKISDLCERYRDGGAFSRSLPYAINYASSPFEFYSGLLDFIAENDGRQIRKISQNDAFSLLYRYFISISVSAADNESEFSALLHDDYKEREKRHFPKTIG